MKTVSVLTSIVFTPARAIFTLVFAVWWFIEWTLLVLWHLILFLLLPDRMDIPEQFARRAQRRHHEHMELLRFIWGTN